jgi:hypothetical protein
MKILTLIGCLFLTACTYNIDSSVAGNYTVSGNTVRNATPQVVVGQPSVIVNPIPVTGWGWGGWGGGWNTWGWGTPWGYGPVVGSWNNYRYGCW